MITLKRDNVVKQTESEVVALALESQGFVREGAAKKAAPENEAPAAEKELKEELAAARSQNAALKQELDGAKDNAVCVVLLGTNNLAENTDGEILEGIRAVCREITGKLAKAVIILQGFYPRNSAREGTAERIAGINLLLNRLAAEENFIYTEPGRVMANSDGYVPEELSSDGLHPSAAGYARIAAVLAPVIRQAAEREK